LTFYFSCLDDVDDEVRDRAALYLKVLKEESLANTYVKEGWCATFSSIDAGCLKIILESVFSLAALESKLVGYINDPEASKTAFDTSSVPKVSRRQAAQESARKS
jgi:coatomer subunit gamma